MYKFSSHLTNSHLLLIRRKVSDGSCAALLLMRTPARRYAKAHYSEKCPQPVKPPKSRKLLFGAIGATLLTGAAVVYAKHSTDTRNWLETNAPLANEFVALVYQENQTYWQFSVNQFNKISTRITEFMFGKEGVSPMDFKQRSEQDLDEDAKEAFAPKEYNLPPPILEPLFVPEKIMTSPDVTEPATLVRTDKCEPQKPIKVHVTKDIVELEHDMHENTKVAIDNYKRALTLCKNYNKALQKVVETPLDGLDKNNFSTLKGARLERDRTIATAKEASAKAKCAIETLDRMIKAGVAAPPEHLTMTKRFLNQFRNDITEVEMAIKEEIEKGVLADKYWDKVEQARKMYKQELEMLFPGVDLCARKLDVKGDTDLLLIYTVKQIQFLQNQIAELQTIRDLKINKAIECKDEKLIIEAKVEDMINRDRVEREKEFQLKTLEIQAEANRKMKETLKRQYEIQQDILQDRLKKKEAEILSKFGRNVSEALEEDRVKFKAELAAMAGKLKAIEQTLKQRAAAEAEARRSQSLWAAAEALLAATRRAAPATRVDNELKALAKAGEGDKLVESVLKGIPPEAQEHGILTESSLRDKFEKLEEITCKVALIGHDGASLPMYFLSWLQSKILFQSLAEIPKDELDNHPTDFTKLDTFDIMHRARYYMDHGNLTNALRYVNLLQGAPRAAAKCWADAARRHLEIRQAAETVMAHASLSGMLYL